MSSTSKKTKQTDQAWVGKIVKGLIVLFSWMPFGLNQAFGKTIGYLLWWIPNTNKRITLINLKMAFPDLDESERQRLAKQSLLHLGMMATELGPVWRWSESKLTSLIKEVKGQERLDEARLNESGVMFLTPHIGCWEMLSVFLSTRYQATFLYRPPNIRAVEDLMVASRGRFGAALAPTDVGGVRTLIKALKNKQVTLVLPDQDAGEKGGVHAPFFGHPARTMTLASKLIQKTDCAVLFVMMERLPNAQGYRLHILPAEEGIASKDEQEAAEALNRGVESCVNTLPEQYLWSYRRYRKPPEGYENPYRKSVKV